ncbi:MAG TPA: alpha-glucosidase C-terminal domain-containing protein, partial [Ignavibacteriaceae bacterium]
RFDADLSGWEKETLKNIKTLVRIRKENSALRYGDFYTILADNDIYAFIRTDLNERVLVVLNKSNSPVNVSLNFPYAFKANTISDLISGKDTPVNDFTVKLLMEPCSYSIYKLKEVQKKDE